MSTYTRLLTAVCAVPFAFSAMYAGTVYVSTTGDNGNDGSTPLLAKLTIQAGIDAAATDDVVEVAEGTYAEAININKKITVRGAGAENTTIVGPTTSNITVFLSASEAVVEHVKITRAGNTVDEWPEALNMNTTGVQPAQMTTGVTIQDCIVEGNRNGVYVNRAFALNIRRNVITNNRTGMQLVNTVDGTTVTNNEITNNWTVGLVIYNNNVSLQTSEAHVNENNISGNWYAAINVRVQGGANVNAYDLSRNYLGTTTPTYVNTNSTEPGYDAQIPVEFGGTAESPGTFEGVIGGTNSAKADFTPWVGSGTDADPGTPGWQPDYSTLYVGGEGAQTGSSGRIAEAVNILTSGGTVWVRPATYTENVGITKALTLAGPNNDLSGYDFSRGSEALIDGYVLVSPSVNGVTINGFEIRGAAVLGEFAGVYVNNLASNITILNNRITRTGGYANAYSGVVTTANGSSNVSVHHNYISGFQNGVYINNGANTVSVVANMIEDVRYGARFISTQSITLDSNGFSGGGVHFRRSATAGTAPTITSFDANTFNVPDSLKWVGAIGVYDSTLTLNIQNQQFNGNYPGGMTLSQRFDLENLIHHRIDGPTTRGGASPAQGGLGYAAISTDGSVYITPESFGQNGSTNPQIQNAIDVASDGGDVLVRGGSYGKQIATGKKVLGTGSNYQFGLFIPHNDFTLRGYGASDALVTNPDNVQVQFTTGATNSFGPAGIYVQGNDVSISGVSIGNNLNNANTVSNDKTIEVIGNNFVLSYSVVTPEFGSIYIGERNEARYLAGTIQEYAVYNNILVNSLVSINNGAGTQGDVSGRQISNNIFTGDPGDGFYSIAFRGWNGASPAQAWIVYPVGGAIVDGNQFNQPVENIVWARGNTGGYVESEIDWQAILDSNSFGNHVIALDSESPFVPSANSVSGYSNTRRITNSIANGMDDAGTGDIVWVGEGTYDEAPILTDNAMVFMAENNDAMLSPGNYFTFGTTGLGDANFQNWDDATFNTLGVNTNGSLQEAANFVNPSGTVLATAGTYSLSAAVTLDSGITLRGPDVADNCDFAPTMIVSSAAGVRTFDVQGSSAVTVKNIALQVTNNAASRFFRVNGTGNVNIENISFTRNSVRLYGMNNAGVQADRDIPKFVDDGNDAGFGSGKVIYGNHAPMPTANIAAAWKGDDANAATVTSVADYGPNGYTLSQTNALRKPTRQEINGNYALTMAATRYVAANVNANIHGGTERTLFVAFRTPNATTAAVVYKHGDNSNGMSVWTNTGGVAGIDIVVDDVHATANFTVTGATWYIAQLYFDGNDATNRVGMTMHGVTSESPVHFDDNQMPPDELTTPTGINSVISLGARQGYSVRNGTDLSANTLGDAFTGSVGEVIVLNTADAATRDAVYCMLSNKWNVGSTDNSLEKDEVPTVYAGQMEAAISNAYPNPATNEVSFDVIPAATEEIRISIVNTMGVEVANVYQGMAHGGSIMPVSADVTALPVGAYMIVVSGESTRFATPLVVKH